MNESELHGESIIRDAALLQDNTVPDNCPISEGIVIEEESSDFDEALLDHRKHPRSTFTYPVECNILIKDSNLSKFSGYIRDISMGGACIECEDKYGRYDINEIKNAKIKISFSMLEGEKVNIFAQIKWIKKIAPTVMYLKMGIEFRYMESWDAIGKLIGMKNKDRNMMWNLWEQNLK